MVIPTYNERENVKSLAQEIIALGLGAVLIFVDDNSPDGTGKVLDEASEKDPQVHVIHREKKEGYGPACVAGIQLALKEKADIIIQMDSDLSHDPKVIPSLIAKLAEADVVIGSRYLSGVNVVGLPMHRLLLSYFANRYIRAVTGIPIRDATTGYRCFHRKALEALNMNNLHSSGYSFLIETNYKLWRNGFRMAEVPIIFYVRRSGDSKMSWQIILEAFFLVWRLRFGF